MNQSDVGAFNLLFIDLVGGDVMSPGSNLAGQLLLAHSPVRANQFVKQKLTVGTGKRLKCLRLVHSLREITAFQEKATVPKSLGWPSIVPLHSVT